MVNHTLKYTIRCTGYGVDTQNDRTHVFSLMQQMSKLNFDSNISTLTDTLSEVQKVESKSPRMNCALNSYKSDAERLGHMSKRAWLPQPRL